MYHVYLLKSCNFPGTFYVGYTTNLDERLKTHNAGRSPHTAKYRPWDLVMYLTFFDESKAKAFETYLKSQSGRAFAQKRFH